MIKRLRPQQPRPQISDRPRSVSKTRVSVDAGIMRRVFLFKGYITQQRLDKNSPSLSLEAPVVVIASSCSVVGTPMFLAKSSEPAVP